jgi:hypothetical protein
MTSWKVLILSHSLRGNPARRVKLAAHDFTRKENLNERWWRRTIGRRWPLGIRQHALDHFVLERSPFHLLDDRSRHLQLVLRRLLRLGKVNFTRPK